MILLYTSSSRIKRRGKRAVLAQELKIGNRKFGPTVIDNMDPCSTRRNTKHLGVEKIGDKDQCYGKMFPRRFYAFGSRDRQNVYNGFHSAQLYPGTYVTNRRYPRHVLSVPFKISPSNEL